MRTLAVFVENRPFFGALLVHVPLLHALRLRAPGARLVLYAPFPQARLLAGIGAADEAVVCAGRFAGPLSRLRRDRPDEVLVLRPASRGLDLAVALAGAPVRAGFDSWLARLLYTRRALHDTAVYRPRKYLALERGAAASHAPLDAWFRAHAAPADAGGAGVARDTLAVLPGGGAGDFKRWAPGHFLALCARLAAEEPSLRFTWVLGPQEAEWRERLAASPVAGRSSVLFDRPVAELAAAAFAARAAVGNDCGPGHVFQMCGCPFACVMGDHDRRGSTRAAEWVDAPNHAYLSLPRPGEPIDAVSVDAAAERVRAALGARPAC